MAKEDHALLEYLGAQIIEFLPLHIALAQPIFKRRIGWPSLSKAQKMPNRRACEIRLEIEAIQVWHSARLR